MAAYSLTDWIGTLSWSSDMKLLSSGEVEVNNIFIEEFFNILIIVDVLLLLMSFFIQTVSIRSSETQALSSLPYY
ncbi:hypothetical protein [Penaeicola halotolerans]|uniref:hypothetical protein n=1 Tax=Penaeicola halotolerans TaxID=2793196 RepID=UPI001CF8EFDF|nr:hypothetical protein [Penaeicola halotolerans]